MAHWESREKRSCEIGKRADLLLIDKAIEDVVALTELRGVMAAGRWYDHEVLDKLIEFQHENEDHP